MATTSAINAFSNANTSHVQDLVKKLKHSKRKLALQENQVNYHKTETSSISAFLHSRLLLLKFKVN
jgi:hypothetical protein